jgi:ribulose-phosphate 3-epimerase
LSRKTDVDPAASLSSSIRLGAALFNADHGRLAEELARLEEAALDFVHLDVFDGHFVPDLGFPPRTIAALRPRSRLPFEVHLGAIEPLRFVPHLVEAGVDLVLVHVESAPLLYETLFAIKDRGIRAGVALGLGTPLTFLDSVLELVDSVLLLSRVTGEGARGANFNPLVVPRVRAARKTAAALELQVAGGVSRHNAAQLAAAGASALALGAGLYQVEDMGQEINTLRALLSGTAFR